MNSITPKVEIELQKAPPEGNNEDCCLVRIYNAVNNFFKAIAAAIWGAVTWVFTKVCCCCCSDDIEIDPPAPVKIPNHGNGEPFPDPFPFPNPRPNPIWGFPRPNPINGYPVNPPDQPIPPEWQDIMNIPDVDAPPEEAPVNDKPVVIGGDPNAAPPPAVELHEHIADKELQPLSEVEIVSNRAEALARIETIAKKKVQFQVHEVRILKFDLDIALEPYDIKKSSAKMFLDLVDYAAPKFKDRESFKQVVEEKHHNFGYYHPELVALTKERIKKICVMLNQLKKDLGPNPSEKKEKAFKTLVKNTAIRINYALNNGNCIVQTNSQMSNICTDVLASMGGTSNPTDQLQLMAGNAIYKHRINLIKKVVEEKVEVNPLWGAGFGGGNEVYSELGLRKEIDDLINHKSAAQPSAKAKEFLDLFEKAPAGKKPDERPLGFLLRALSDPYGANLDVGTLREDLRNWGNHYLGLVNEDGEIVETDEEAKTLIKLLSGKTEKGEIGDAFSTMANTTFYSETGALWLLEESGILELSKEKAKKAPFWKR